MDPQATYRLMMDDSNDLDTRAVAATDLLVWLANGGRPGRLSRADLLDHCRHTIFKALDALSNATEGSPA
jgi:hypothetical protein